MIGNALNTVLVRTSRDTQYTLIKSEMSNVGAFIKTPFTVLVVVFIALMIMRIWRKNHLPFRKNCKRLVPYILIGLIPFLWYAFAVNHSTIHFWFTNKALVVSVLAMMCGLVELDGSSEETI